MEVEATDRARGSVAALPLVAVENPLSTRNRTAPRSKKGGPDRGVVHAFKLDAPLCGGRCGEHPGQVDHALTEWGAS